MPRIILIGTCDTKLQELLYLRSQILSHDSTSDIIFIDVGRSPEHHSSITITQNILLSKYGSVEDVSDLPRGVVIKVMASAATKCVEQLLHDNGPDYINGIVAAGGSGGTSLASAVMRDALPIGMPKLIVSTVASGDTGPVVGETDISLMYSVVDIAGLNSLLRTILDNAAGAIVGMARAFEKRITDAGDKSTDMEMQPLRVGITMFGVTTPCVDKIRQYLETRWDVEVSVFHATGHGGRAMERLVSEGKLDAVIDLTTTEICDFVAGGVMSAGPNRLEAALKRGIPYIISLGATDMVNFGPIDTVPEKYKKRKLYEHNPTVTLMRTDYDECTQIGEFIGEKVERFAKTKENVQVWFPMGGVSMLATKGGPFEDSKADGVTRDTIRRKLMPASGVKILQDERQINDEGFAEDVAEAFMMIVVESDRRRQKGEEPRENY
jgi:uncharacterized protein (UPF0261 family)